MRAIFNNFDKYYNAYTNAVENMNKMATDFVTKVLSNEDTQYCGEIYDEYLRIKVDVSYTSNVVVDKVVYDKDTDRIVVYDEDGGKWWWDELYTDDKALIAHAIYSKFVNDFMRNNFHVVVEGKTVTPELVDYLTAYECKDDYKTEECTNVYIEENYS